MLEFSAGDTVLVDALVPREMPQLEPVVLLEACSSDASSSVRARRLKRMRRDLGNSDALPNEVVLTTEEVKIPFKSIKQRCPVRFFSKLNIQERQVPPPFSHGGTGNSFIVTAEEREGWLSPVSSFNRSIIKESLLPSTSEDAQPLRGLDLFCGSGNFGRGIEDAAACVQLDWAVDVDADALHSYRTHSSRPGGTKYYLGSVNDYLAHAIHGQGRTEIARPREVDLILPGSPCVGWSRLNVNKNSDKAQQACSLIASTLASIGFHRTRLGILENVGGMALPSEGRSGEPFFTSARLFSCNGIPYVRGPFLSDLSRNRRESLDCTIYYVPLQSHIKAFIFIIIPFFSRHPTPCDPIGPHSTSVEPARPIPPVSTPILLCSDGSTE